MEIHYPISDHLNKFMVSLLHKETSETGKKKYFVECQAPWLEDGIVAIKNIGLEILMYIQIFILVKAAFFLGRIKSTV